MNEMRCYVCGNTDFEERRVEYIYRRGGKYLLVRDVPCEVCLHCGERYYDADVLLKIERRFNEIYKENAQPQVEVQVPVEKFAS